MGHHLEISKPLCKELGWREEALLGLALMTRVNVYHFQEASLMGAGHVPLPLTPGSCFASSLSCHLLPN